MACDPPGLSSCHGRAVIADENPKCMAGLGGFLFIYACLYERRYLFVLIGAACVALLIPEIRDRITDLGQGNEMAANQALNSYAWRKELWTSGLNWMEKKPLLVWIWVGLIQLLLHNLLPISCREIMGLS